MTRWNIKRLLFYSYDNRTRIIDFDLKKVNIITGNSRTGKSTLVEVIDYVMGSRRCEIAEHVQSTCSWVGIVWSNGETEFVLCRRIPDLGYRSSQDYYFSIAQNVVIPETTEKLQRNIDRTNALKKFEQLLGIGSMDSETFGSVREPQRISLRHVVPYMLQDDDTIINKTNLFRLSRQDGSKDIIDRIPYFIGVVDESSVRKEVELRQLRARLRAAEKKMERVLRLEEEDLTTAKSLALQAVQVGILDRFNDESSLEELKVILRQVVNWLPESTVAPENDQLENLYNEKKQIQSQMSALRSQIRSASRFMEQATDYGVSTNTQRRRLEIVDLIPPQNGTELCPVCHQSFTEISEPISAIREAFSYVQTELEQVERERPQLDEYINERENQILVLQDRISSLNRQIAALRQESERVRERLDLDQRRHRVVGSINFYLNMSDNVEQDEGQENIDELETQIATLEEEVGRDEKLEKLRAIQIRLSNTANQIVADLPFEERYEDDPVDINLRDLSVGVITPTGRILMRRIGSDQNYLTFHVAVHLALHRHFSRLNRPVPGVLVFDQLSRPFYPQDEDDVNEKVIMSTDALELKKYFDLLFDEVEREDGLQIIILEHAYFADDERFVDATKERWIPGNRYLIPSDWPERSKTG